MSLVNGRVAAGIASMKKFPSVVDESDDDDGFDDGFEDDDDMSFMSNMFPRVSKELLLQTTSGSHSNNNSNNNSNNYSPLTLPSVLREALPLMRFVDSIQLAPPKVLTGDTIKTVASVDLENNYASSNPYDHNQLKCMKLANLYRKRCQEEEIMRREDALYSNGYDDAITVSSGTTASDREKRIKDKLLYTSSLFTPLKKGKVTSTSTATNVGDDTDEGLDCNQELVFDSDFECGNLESATRVNGRGIFDNLYNGIAEQTVQQEYDLTLRNDINTSGNIQWFYFSITAGHQCSSAMRIRINIINFTKNDSLYNYGLQPVACVVDAQETASALQWTHIGDDIAYYPNGKTVALRKKKDKVVIKKLYTLSFSMVIEPGQKVYLAHCYPYTYSDLQRYLAKLESNDNICDIFHRKLLCKTLCGNKCDMLIITARSDVVDTTKPAIIISARVHPGESNSSYIIQGIINYLLDKDNKDAEILRKNYIFKIVPMLNPDGVIHGNYRCSLAGVDLNRQYNKSAAYTPLLPTIVAFKDMVESTRNQRGVSLFLDIHGHSKKKNAFFYGCDYSLQGSASERELNHGHLTSKVRDQRVFCRIFPAILCKISEYFSEDDCSFSVAKSKGGTGRVVSWKDFGIEGSYTIEASFCSNGDNSRDKANKGLLKEFLKRDADICVSEFEQSLPVSHYSQLDYQQMGCDVIRGILHYSNLQSPSGKNRSMDTSSSAGNYTNSDDDTVYTSVNAQLNPIQRYSTDMLGRPLLIPGVFEEQVLPINADSASTIRLHCEREIRMKLKSAHTAPYSSNGLASEECIAYNSDGSDSDPSIDNVPINKVLKKLSGNNKDSSTAEIVQAFRKMTIQRSKMLRKSLEEKVSNLLNNSDESATLPVAAPPKEKPKLQSFKSITSTITAIKRMKSKTAIQEKSNFKTDKRLARAISGSGDSNGSIGMGTSVGNGSIGTSVLLRKNSGVGSLSADFSQSTALANLVPDVKTSLSLSNSSSSASIIQFITEGIKDTGSEDIFIHKSFKPLSTMKQKSDSNKWGVPVFSPMFSKKKALAPFANDSIKNLAVSYDSNTASPIGSMSFSKSNMSIRASNAATYSNNEHSSYSPNSPLKASAKAIMNPFTVTRQIGQDVVVQLNERPTIVIPSSELSPIPSRKTLVQRLNPKN